MRNVLIIAHRGSSYTAPENTIPSFNLAFKEGANFVEGDFWLTKDNQIVCIHDSNTKRVTLEKIRLKIKSSTLNELRKLDVGSFKGNEFSGTKIPTLQEVLDIIPEGKGLYLEIKDARKVFIEKLVETIEQNLKTNGRYFLSGEIRVIAFNPNTVQIIKKHFPEMKVYWLFSWYLLKKKCLISIAQKRLLQTLEKLNCDGINVKFVPTIDEKLIEFLHQKGMDFCVYDVDAVEDAINLVNLGVDSITTNYPLKIRNGVQEYFSGQNH